MISNEVITDAYELHENDFGFRNPTDLVGWLILSHYTKAFIRNYNIFPVSRFVNTFNKVESEIKRHMSYRSEVGEIMQQNESFTQPVELIASMVNSILKSVDSENKGIEDWVFRNLASLTGKDDLKVGDFNIIKNGILDFLTVEKYITTTRKAGISFTPAPPNDNGEYENIRKGYLYEYETGWFKKVNAYEVVFQAIMKEFYPEIFVRLMQTEPDYIYLARIYSLYYEDGEYFQNENHVDLYLKYISNCFKGSGVHELIEGLKFVDSVDNVDHIDLIKGLVFDWFRAYDLFLTREPMFQYASDIDNKYFPFKMNLNEGYRNMSLEKKKEIVRQSIMYFLMVGSNEEPSIIEGKSINYRDLVISKFGELNARYMEEFQKVTNTRFQVGYAQFPVGIERRLKKKYLPPIHFAINLFEYLLINYNVSEVIFTFINLTFDLRNLPQAEAYQKATIFMENKGDQLIEELVRLGIIKVE